MATEATAAAEPINDQLDFAEGIVPEATAWIKWNVKGGSDRKNEPEIGVHYELNGQPNIQGVEIRSNAPVILYAWSSPNGSGPLDLSVYGPTSGQVRNDPIRIGSYRIDFRG